MLEMSLLKATAMAMNTLDAHQACFCAQLMNSFLGTTYALLQFEDNLLGEHFVLARLRLPGAKGYD